MANDLIRLACGQPTFPEGKGWEAGAGADFPLQRRPCEEPHRRCAPPPL